MLGIFVLDAVNAVGTPARIALASEIPHPGRNHN